MSCDKNKTAVDFSLARALLLLLMLLLLLIDQQSWDQTGKQLLYH
jgi:hypothetical protein